MAAFLRDHNTIDERSRRTQPNSERSESVNAGVSQTRVTDEAGSGESKPFITNFVFLLVNNLQCTFGTKHFAIFSHNT